MKEAVSREAALAWWFLFRLPWRLTCLASIRFSTLSISSGDAAISEPIMNISS